MDFKNHLKTVMNHKKEVFKLCCVAGIPLQGITHDLSKFSPTEFWESAKYYQGNRSPISACKEDKGYSDAWQHHKGRNKHHWEYWVDKLSDGGVPIQMPYKYAVEMVCDIISASKTYNGANFRQDIPYSYFVENVSNRMIHPKTNRFVGRILNAYKTSGIIALLPTYTKRIYREIESQPI